MAPRTAKAKVSFKLFNTIHAKVNRINGFALLSTLYIALQYLFVILIVV